MIATMKLTVYPATACPPVILVRLVLPALLLTGMGADAADNARTASNPYLEFVQPAAPLAVPVQLLAISQLTLPANGTSPSVAPAPAAKPKTTNGGVPSVTLQKPAGNTQAPDISSLLRAFGQYFTEEETDLLLDYLRDSAMASINGGEEEILLPPDLAFKLEILQQRMKKEGAFYFQALIQQLEHDLDRAMREYRNPPSPPPYALPQERTRTP